MSEYITELTTELETGERELPPILDEEELDEEDTLLEKLMGDDFQKFFEVEQERNLDHALDEKI